MSMNTYLKGRLRNTALLRSQGLMPLYEAVVNAIQAIADTDDPEAGQIRIEIIRTPQQPLLEDARQRRGAPPQEPIVSFRIVDNGIGFDERNMSSFETLDSDYKAKLGCRGVGRLLWLKAFEAVNVQSTFCSVDGAMRQRRFAFTPAQGVTAHEVSAAPPGARPSTAIELAGFDKPYREASPKTAATIAQNIFEHCLWYFVREGGAPAISVADGEELIDLHEVYAAYMLSSSTKERIKLKGHEFELTHLRLKAGADRQHFMAWCAAGRVVEKEPIGGKISGLHGRIKDPSGDFHYACYITSPYLDGHVRPERIGFDIENISDDLFSDAELGTEEIREAVVACASQHLRDHLDTNAKASRDRVERFVSERAPRYRPILGRIEPARLSVDPDISDRDLDLLLHRHLADLEGSLLAEGHEMMNFGSTESPADYQARLQRYLEKVDDIKKSDLANYVFHRKIVLDILEKAIGVGADGRYAREELIHDLIMPMRKTSDEVFSDGSNLWLIDERLAFHNFLASDRPLSSLPITGSTEAKEPDLCALNVFDEPLLVNDSQKLPLGSIVVVEIKRPMRNDAAAGEDKDPIEQALGYLDRIREGGVKTARGRPIPGSDTIPGFCYVIADLTATVRHRCKMHSLRETSDKQGYFGFNDNFKAYIEVISFDRLLNAARERNRAFFDKLGLPTE
ncbi:MAG: ATP-binding protein [Mitsuaria chitosanitabida]|jgi:hypothetical protein|uniref:ATP-binding protein n=1 Tax=Roseateles chitosanitabidus TaxID=65048 RepID=UPI001B139714|nr:ATP-binding protein [Roseateles chitosanitabidus]MBO9685709.1 ATP-binding protein [Roseateles chitosanitabidus]